MGSHLVEALVKRGEQVRVLVRPGSKTEHLDQLGIELSPGDLGDIHSLRNAAQNVDMLYHCAALAADWGSWKDFENTNVVGTRNLLQVALEKDLNFAPKVDFEKGMQHVKDWLLQIGYI